MSAEPAGWGRPLYAHVLDAADVGPGISLLDLGCGTGEFAAAAVARGARVVGVDIDPTAVKLASASVGSVRFEVGDAHDLGPEDALGGPFAVVAAMQLLTHVANPLRVLREASRVAAPGGTVVASVWGRDEECDVGLLGQALARWLPQRRSPSGGHRRARRRWPTPTAFASSHGWPGSRCWGWTKWCARSTTRTRPRWSTRSWRR